ncbi:hypothetical protein QZH41_001362 [Actinostola sp. cb2023]|nr:hypothetical protein QZH41_001362 [Actinostola sp. cb2023]
MYSIVFIYRHDKARIKVRVFTCKRVPDSDQCAIVITPPEKSMLLCFSSDEQKIALFESHTHGNHGVVVLRSEVS